MVRQRPAIEIDRIGGGVKQLEPFTISVTEAAGVVDKFGDCDSRHEIFVGSVASDTLPHGRKAAQNRADNSRVYNVPHSQPLSAIDEKSEKMRSRNRQSADSTQAIASEESR